MQSILCLQNKAVLQNLKCFDWCIDPPFFFMKQSTFAKFEMFWLIHRSPLIQDIAESIRASGLNFNKFFATLTFKTYTSQFFFNRIKVLLANLHRGYISILTHTFKHESWTKNDLGLQEGVLSSECVSTMKYQCEFWVIYGYESGGYLVSYSLPTMCNIIIRGLSEPAPAMHVWSHHYSVGGMDYGFGISKRWFGICNNGFGICDDVFSSWDVRFLDPWSCWCNGIITLLRVYRWLWLCIVYL